MALSNEDSGYSVGKHFKHEDLLEFSNIFASEFNNRELHDRILILKVIEDDHSTIPIKTNQQEVEENENNQVASEEEIQKVSIYLYSTIIQCDRTTIQMSPNTDLCKSA